jgi:hypothetical protein
VDGGGVLILAGNVPEGGLLAIPGPMALAGLLDGMVVSREWWKISGDVLRAV